MLINTIKITRLYLLFTFISGPFTGFCQKKFHLDLTFLKNQVDSMYVTIDNGIEQKQHLLTETKLVIEDYFKSEYVSIQLTHPRPDGQLPFLEYGFFIDSRNVSAIVDVDSKGRLKLVEGKNISPFDEKGAEDFRKITNNSFNEFWEYYNKNISRLGQVDSVTTRAFELNKQHSLKVLEAIQTLNTSYYSFWMFRRVISNNPDISREVKEELLNNKFTSYHGTYEYELIKDYIVGSEIQIDELIEPFESLDIITDETVNTKAIDKPLLMITWASWCAPCIRKILQLQNLSSEYPDLNFLFINLDSDIDRAKEMITKRAFNGHHFSHLNKGIPREFLNQIVGKIYLLDGESRVQYNLDLAPDPNFERLKQNLQTSFSN